MVAFTAFRRPDRSLYVEGSQFVMTQTATLENREHRVLDWQVDDRCAGQDSQEIRTAPRRS
jgi:hypothetical protein